MGYKITGGGSFCSVRAVGHMGQVPQSCCTSPNPGEHPQSQTPTRCKTLAPPGCRLPCIPSTCSWSPHLVPIAGVALYKLRPQLRQGDACYRWCSHWGRAVGQQLLLCRSQVCYAMLQILFS